MKRALWVSVLLAACGNPANAATQPWTLIQGPSVIVVGQQSAKTLRHVALEIEQFRTALGGLLRGAGMQPPIATAVYTFTDRKALEPFVPLYNGRPAELGGYCHCGTAADGSFIAVNLSSNTESSRIIFHECTHLLLRQSTRNLPVWLNEGLAEYYSTFRLKSDGRRAEIGAPIPSHLALLRRRLIPIAELTSVDQSSTLYNESERRSIFYAEAWALTHYLLQERPSGAAAVNRYITALADGRPAEPAFTDAFGMTPSGMDAALRQYARRPAFRSVTYTLADPVDANAPARAQTMPAAETEARLGIVQLRVGRMAEATTRIEAAAASGPDVAQAQLALGLLRLGQDRDEEAWGQYTFALTVLRRYDDWMAAADDPREKAHAALTRAIAINPQSTEALAWQAYADLALDTRMPEARNLMTRAVTLAPMRPDYRLRLAEVCVRQGDYAEARRLLAGLARERDLEVSRAALRLLISIDDLKR